jgi:CRISPR-associated endoribonuclease Cas6
LTPVIIPNSPQKKKETGQRYIGNISEVDLSKYFSDRASKLADRKVDLKVTVDEFYLKSTNGKGETVDIKGGRDHSRAVGFRFPFLLSGKAEDLKFVWYSGLGARTRMGAGIFGLNDI